MGPYGGNIYCLSVSGTNIFAGTAGGVWFRPLSEMITSIEQTSDQLPEKYALYQNYPNPFNAKTRIAFEIPNRSHVKINILDVKGQFVQQVMDKDLQAGTYTMIYDAKLMTSGIYLLQMKTERFTEVKKMLLLK